MSEVKTRQVHTAEFKAKVGLEALRGMLQKNCRSRRARLVTGGISAVACVLSAMLREIPALAWYLGRPITTVREACPGHRVYLQPPRNWLKSPRRLRSGGAPARAVLAFRRICGRKRPNSPSGTASPRLPSP